MADVTEIPFKIIENKIVQLINSIESGNLIADQKKVFTKEKRAVYFHR